MNFFNKPTNAEPSGVRLGFSPDGISMIAQPDCAAAIWQRTPLASFQSWIDQLPEAQLPSARIILEAGRVQAALQELADVCGTPDGPERRMLIDDIAALSSVFADAMEVRYLRLRLDVISTNACRKFHIDAVTARLVCTYRGTGTQYGHSVDHNDPETIFTVATGSPIVLRGTKWPNLSDASLLHRSPPIEGSGETRLLLVLDPVLNVENEPDFGDRIIH